MARRGKSGDVEKHVETDRKPRPGVDIEPCNRSHGINLPWPSTLPPKYALPYDKVHKKGLRLFILPSKHGYDPIMAEVEQAVVKLSEKRNITVVVADCDRGVGEILSRRCGMNLLVVHTNLPGSASGPGNQQRAALKMWPEARRAVARNCDAALLVDDGVGYEQMVKTLARAEIRTKTFKLTEAKRLKPMKHAVDTSEVKPKKTKKSK